MPVPLALIAGLLGGGALLRGIGGHRQAAADQRRATAEDLRLEAEQKARAGGRAALMRGILNATGYGHAMTDEQMIAMLTGSDRRTIVSQPSIFGTVGGLASGLGSALALGTAGGVSPTAATGAAQAASSDQWDQFLQALLASQQRPGGIGAGTVLR